ncbi:MAG: acyl carrier protein [Clostridia bacterium]|nr:acyl carrier protein [Clostridia bacterium]
MIMLEKITQILVEQLGVDESEVTPESNFIDDLGADSLDVFQIVIAIEEQFDIEISDQEAENIRTVGEAMKYIKSKMGQDDED